LKQLIGDQTPQKTPFSYGAEGVGAQGDLSSSPFCSTPPEPSKSQSDREGIGLWNLPAWAKEFLLDLRLFLRRSRSSLFRREVLFLDLGPELGRHHEDGHLLECSRTRGRMSDMQRFRSLHPDLSLHERAILLEGWNMGSEWAYRNPHCCKKRPEDTGAVACDTRVPFYWKGSYFKRPNRLKIFSASRASTAKD
jgi:hypothetical protein